MREKEYKNYGEHIVDDFENSKKKNGFSFFGMLSVSWAYLFAIVMVLIFAAIITGNSAMYSQAFGILFHFLPISIVLSIIGFVGIIVTSSHKDE